MLLKSGEHYIVHSFFSASFEESNDSELNTTYFLYKEFSIIVAHPIRQSLVFEEGWQHQDVQSVDVATWTRWELHWQRSFSNLDSWEYWVSCDLFYITSKRYVDRWKDHNVFFYHINEVILLSFLYKLRQTINSCCQVKLKYLYLLMWEKAWLCNASTELHQQLIGTSKVLEIQPQSSLLCLALTTMTLFVGNSGTIHASDWRLEVVNITWWSPTWPRQTQPFTTVSIGHQLQWKFPGLFLSVWRIQVSVFHYQSISRLLGLVGIIYLV